MTFADRNRGGTRVYARSLLAALRERDDVIAWVIGGPKRSNLPGTMAWLARGAHRAVKDKPPNVLHCPSFVAPWRIPLPYVVTVHDAGGRRFPQDHPLEWRVYDRGFLASRLRAAARVITGSKFARDEIVAVYGLAPERVAVIPYGLDARYMTRTDVERRDERRVILFPGAPVARKNLDAVLECMAGARAGSALATAFLEISGATADRFPHHVRRIEALGLRTRVAWLGQLSAEDMHRTMSGATVVVYPSFYEGFGFPPLEAMAAGTPVVASDRGSLPEVLGQAALLVDPRDIGALATALESVMTNEQLRDRLRREGQAHARTFTWARCAELTCDLYREVHAETHKVAV